MNALKNLRTSHPEAERELGFAELRSLRGGLPLVEPIRVTWKYTSFVQEWAPWAIDNALRVGYDVEKID